MDYSPFLRDEPFILTVAGGKEGTGKSLVAINMAIQFAQAGLHIILIDHDLASANMQTLYQINSESTSQSPRNRLETFLMEEGVPNLLMIPGNNFGLDFTSMNSAHKSKFFSQVREISSADMVIIDLGGGSSEQALDILLLAHAGIVVTNTEPTSVIHAYEFFKNAVYRTIFRMFRDQGELQATVHEVLTRQGNQQQPTIQELIAAIAIKNPWAAQQLLAVCNDLNFYLILNQAHSPNDAQLAAKLHSICRKFLNIDLNFAGLLFANSEIPARPGIVAPLSITHPDSITCQTISHMGNFIFDNMMNLLLQETRRFSFEEQLQQAVVQAHNDFPKNSQST